MHTYSTSGILATKEKTLTVVKGAMLLIKKLVDVSFFEIKITNFLFQDLGKIA